MLFIKVLFEIPMEKMGEKSSRAKDAEKVGGHYCAVHVWDGQWAVRGRVVWCSDEVSSISLRLTNSFKQCNHGLKYVAGSSDDTIDLWKQ